MTLQRAAPGLSAAQKFISPWLWLLLGLFAAEFILFDQFGAHRYTGIYPRWNDQIQYLGEAYTGYEYARAHGFVRGLWQTLVNPSAQGTLHDFAALIAFSAAGPSRSAALALNVLALIGWQVALVLAVARAGGSRALGFAAAMLPLALSGPWQDIPGSAYDFRLDHLAMCAFGIAGAMAWCTDGLKSRGWSIAFGVAVGLTLLTRFLTGTYFVVIFVTLLGWSLCHPHRGRRVTNLLLAALVAAALAGPVCWLNREWVWNYYWIGHYIGPESAIRNSHLNLWRSLAFVVQQLAGRHLGIFFGGLALVGTIGFAVFRSGASAPIPGARYRLFLAATFLLAPALVLTLHQQKSEIVVSALVPGVVLLVVALWLRLAPGRSLPAGDFPAPARARSHVHGSIAPGIAIAALAFFAVAQLRPANDAANRADFDRVALLADQIFARANAGGLREPRIAVDYITDCLDAQVLRVFCYERHRVWVPFEMTLPISIAEPSEGEVMERLARSDFVFLSEEAPAGNFPFDHKLAALRPMLRAWCEEHLRAVERFPLFGRRMVLYQRREIPLPEPR